MLLGHLDSKAGPWVFFRLAELRPGELIHVARRDGRTAVFRTTAVERVQKSTFPTDRVYGDLSGGER